MEWNINEIIYYENDENIYEHILVKLPCSVPNFPELRIEGCNGVVELADLTKWSAARGETTKKTVSDKKSTIKIETLALVQGYEETLKIKEHQKKFCITEDISESDVSIEDWKQLSDCSDDRSIDNNHSNDDNNNHSNDNDNHNGHDDCNNP